MKILRATDKVKIKIGDVSVLVQPLTEKHKVEMMGLTTVVNGVETRDSMAIAAFVLKHSVKAMDGVMDYNDKPYELAFDGDALDDESTALVLNVSSSIPMFLTGVISVAQNRRAEIIDQITGDKVKGVTVSVNPKSRG